jgi:integrase
VEDVLSYFDSRVKEGLAPASARKEIVTLGVVLDTALTVWGWNGSNPVPEAKRLLRRDKRWQLDRERTRRLSREDEIKLLAELSEDMQRIVRFALETAMRRGEIVAARPEHVHGSLLHIPQTKTDVARTIPLSSVALELTKFLPFKLGESAISHSFQRACKRVTPPLKDLHFHDLRHEATSRLFERGFQIQEVALITGHRDWKSLKRYTQLKPEDLVSRLSIDHHKKS